MYVRRETTLAWLGVPSEDVQLKRLCGKYIGRRTCWLGNKEALRDDHFIFRVPGPVDHAFTTLHGEVDVSHYRHCWKSLDAGHCRIQTNGAMEKYGWSIYFRAIYALGDCLTENRSGYIYQKSVVKKKKKALAHDHIPSLGPLLTCELWSEINTQMHV